MIANIRNIQALAAAGLLCACAGSPTQASFNEPYVLFEPEYTMRMQQVVPVAVRSVDGDPVPRAAKNPVKPGPRTVEVTVAPGGSLMPIVRQVSVAGEPCTRYFLGARTTTADDWNVSVTRSEPIGECKRAK